MDKVDTNVIEIKNIIKKWFEHTGHIFVVIVFSLLIFSSSVVIQQKENVETISGYDSISALTKDTFTSGCKLIAFPLIIILFYLICYTVYAMSCIIRRIFSSGFNSTIFVVLCLLILSNCIFSYLIGQIGNWCLQAKIPNGFPKGLFLSLRWNVLLQSGVIISLLFIKGRVRFITRKEISNNIFALRIAIKNLLKKEREWKKIWLAIMCLLFFFIALIWVNGKWVWIDGPLIRVLIDKNFDHSIPYFLEFVWQLLVCVLSFIVIWFIIKPKENDE